ncbi:MAG: hypothetical protein ACK4TA_00875 [Saprospiraceae bacterium]
MKHEEELEKDHIWKILIPEDPYDDVRFRKYCSDLLKLIENFIAQQVYEEKTITRADYLLEAIKKRKLNRFYSGTVKEIHRTFEQTTHRSSEFYLNQFLISKSKDAYESEFDRSIKRNIEEINEYLNQFFFSEKLRYYCTVLDQKYTKTYSYDLKFIQEVIDHIEKNDYSHIPSISVYYQVFLALHNDQNLDHYYKLKDLLEKNGLKFPQEEAVKMYEFATNYCIDKINKGDQKFQRELFDLYKDIINKEILLLEGMLSPWYFRNIITIALRLGENEWTEQFILQYKDKLPEEMKKNAVTYNLAQVYFYQKRYDDVKVLLQEVEFDDFSYNLNSKAMLLAIYYETDEIEPLFSHFESFRTYLNRHKDIPSDRRQNYANLIKFTKKLTKIIPGDKKAIQKLKQELEVTKNVVSRNWLLQKVAELDN